MHNDPARFLEYFRLERKRANEGLSICQLERWSELRRHLDGRLKTAGGPERARRSVRIPTRLHCSFASRSEFDEAVITDLSAGGVFIETASPLPIGEKLRLHLHVGGAGAGIEVDAVVVSNNVGSGFDARTGMGLRFAGADGDVIGRIHDLYERELERAAAARRGPT